MSTYAARIFLAVNGFPVVYAKSVDYKVATNRELVVGMSPTGRPVGFTEGTKEYDLSVDCYIPKSGDLAWENITNAVIVAMTDTNAGKVFTGVFVVSVGSTYQEKGQAVRKVEMRCLNVSEF